MPDKPKWPPLPAGFRAAVEIAAAKALRPQLVLPKVWVGGMFQVEIFGESIKLDAPPIPDALNRLVIAYVLRGIEAALCFILRRRLCPRDMQVTSIK